MTRRTSNSAPAEALMWFGTSTLYLGKFRQHWRGCKIASQLKLKSSYNVKIVREALRDVVLIEAFGEKNDRDGPMRASIGVS